MADDVAALGRTKGGIIRQPGNKNVGWRVAGRQPGSLAVEFGCYYDSAAGFYLAAYDQQGVPKELSLRRSPAGLDMDWRTPCCARHTFASQFDVVMTTFHRDERDTPINWRDAADIYKQWALRQPWCRTLYADRRDIPTWLKEGPAMVRFGREWLATPSRIEKWVTNYWQKNYPAAPLITALWGWEKVGSWVAPDYFPAFPSDEQFTQLVAHLRQQGCHAFPWPSGYHWTLTYRKQEDGSYAWDDRKRFDEVARPHAVYNRDGTLYIRTPSWLFGGDTACMCPGDPWTIRWWNNDICVPLAQRGCEMIQVDQVVGGSFPFCYSEQHGHPPGPGSWMADVFTRQLVTMHQELRKIEPDCVVCFEEPNERFNHLVGIQDYRDCESSDEWASVFNYVYHEYLPTFQSNPRPDDLVMAAYCLVNGQMPHLRPAPQDLQEATLANGSFESTAGGGHPLPSWDQVRGYQGQAWNGVAMRDDAEMHDGQSSLQLTNRTDTDVVQVSQNVPVTSGGGLTAGKNYRLSVWLRTGEMRQPNSINFAFFGPSMKYVGPGGRLFFPAGDAGWSHVQSDFTVPPGATLMRIMIHVAGPAQAWVDEMRLEELSPDGTSPEVRMTGMTDAARFMRRWVELYHGAGRPWLQFGRMLHPPQLICGTMPYRDWHIPVILHNAFRAHDGREAVVLVNGSAERQTATLKWKGNDRELDLQPREVMLIKTASR